MRVFISHKNEDSNIALIVHKALVTHNVDSYLDVLDRFADDGEELISHIKTQLNDCTDIIVVISENTKLSWWVPFEIGMAAQIDMPTASFLLTGVDLPSYLAYWPRLKSVHDIRKYVESKRRIDLLMELRHDNLSTASKRRYGTPEFYRLLKAELRK